MATHSIILAWRIPWTEEPGGPQSMGSHREPDCPEKAGMVPECSGAARWGGGTSRRAGVGPAEGEEG